MLPIDPEAGAIGEAADLVGLEGETGPHRVEQPFAKPHRAGFGPAGRFAAVPDKGLDRVFAFRLDPPRGKLAAAEQGSVAAREGSGPRHVAFHPSAPHAYVVNELDSTVAAHRYDPERGALEPFQVLPALPDTFVGDSRAAEIAVSPDGRFVHASNRGHDSVVALAVDAGTGRLAPRRCPPSGGRTPRFFAPDPAGRFLYAANEDSDTILSLHVAGATGAPALAGEVAETGSPVRIVFRDTAQPFRQPGTKAALLPGAGTRAGLA